MVVGEANLKRVASREWDLCCVGRALQLASDTAWVALNPLRRSRITLVSARLWVEANIHHHPIDMPGTVTRPDRFKTGFRQVGSDVSSAAAKSGPRN